MSSRKYDGPDAEEYLNDDFALSLQTLWKEKNSDKRVILQDHIKISAAVEGRWFEGVIYRFIGEKDSNLYCKTRENFLSKFERITV